MYSSKRTVKVRYDRNHVRLNKGESVRADGRYCYRWTSSDGKRQTVYANTLNELRFKEQGIAKDREDGIKEDQTNTTVNDVFELWKQTKRGIRDQTFKSYIYMYELFVKPNFGRKRIQQVKRTDVKMLYNGLVESRGLSIATLDNVHTVLHQVLQLAADDYIIRNNPSDRMLTELKRSYGRSEPRKALTVAQEKLLFKSMLKEPKYRPWYPIIYIMGVLKDKAVEEIVGLSAGKADYIITVTPPNNPRGMKAFDLAQIIKDVNPKVSAADSVEEALEEACLLEGDGVVLAFGSLSYMGRLREAYETHAKKHGK